MQARHPSLFLPLHFSLLTRKKTAFMASESSCVYIFRNSHKSFLKCTASKQITGICFFYSACHEKRSLNQMCISTILSHSLLLYIQTYSVVRLHLSDTRLAGLPVAPVIRRYQLRLSFLWWKIQPPATCESDYTSKSPGWQSKIYKLFDSSGLGGNALLVRLAMP